MASLDEPLKSTEIPSELRKVIIESFWGPHPLPKQLFNGETGSIPSLDAYFKYYSSQCRIIALHEGGKYASVKTHKHIAGIVQFLRRPLARDVIRIELPTSVILDEDEVETGTKEKHDNSIDLAARLLLMIEFGSLSYAFSGSRRLIWNKGTLKKCLRAHFCVPPVLGHERIKFEKTFNGRNLSRMAGIEIEWTDNLLDHLRMMNDDKKVAIFHHASFLEYQQGSLFPDGLVNETLRTLALLFPQSDRKTRDWLQKVSQKSTPESRVAKCGSLRADDRQIENFIFWHDRLVILKQVFDEARPSTLSQWWCDRRNGVQWYTFWVAVLVLVLTIFFGVVQCLEGALQVYKAFHPSQKG